MGLPYYDAFDVIMQPTLNPSPNMLESDILKAMEAHKLNHPQAKAVLSALATKGFSLIQGSV
jgi:senataxin